MDSKELAPNATATEKQLEESSITMLDVLEQEKEMEEEYAAVLGASDEKCCTYADGPVKRQALYSCLTCCPEARDLDKCAGICLACSYRCHEHHELVELYTKRNFRCDCPTERLGGNRCVLNAALGSLPQSRNACNLYNQNFQGLYCNCHRPYPDPERTTEEIMLQCAVCEDWFHLQHVNAPPSAAKLIDTCSEMICDGCMKRHTFLKDYSGLALRALDDLDESALNVTVSGDVSLCEGEDNDNKLRSDLDKSISEIMNMGEVGTGTPQPNSVETANDLESEGQKEESIDEPKCESEKEPEAKRQKLDEVEEKKSDAEDREITKCRRPTSKNEYEKGATFWGNDWRSALCQCCDCLELYKSQNVEFLLDAEDSAKTYEERGIKRAATESSSYEQGIRALASIGHVQQIDAITEYNRMKDKLKEYLQTFAASKKVVTEEDINRFFQEMRNEKNTNVGQPHFCR